MNLLLLFLFLINRLPDLQGANAIGPLGILQAQTADLVKVFYP